MCVPAFTTKLFPPPKEATTLRYTIGLSNRQKLSAKLAANLAEQVLKEMISRRQRRNMDPECSERMLQCLQRGTAPLVFILFHFFETYMAAKLQRLESTPPGIESNRKLQEDILAQYPDEMLLQIHQMYHLLLHLFFRRLSKPALPVISVITRRRLRRPPNADIAKVFVFGGVAEVARIYAIKGYLKRRRAFDEYVRMVDAERGVGKAFPRMIQRVATKLGRKPPVLRNQPFIAKLRHEEVDDLLTLWTPVAQERLLARNIVDDLEEVGCCGRFVTLLLTTAVDDDDDDDEEEEDEEEEEEDDEDYDDSGDEDGSGSDTDADDV